MGRKVLWPCLLWLGAVTAFAQGHRPDIDKLWDFDRLAESEKRFRSALRSLSNGGADRALRLELLTQIARAQGLQGRFTQAHSTLDTVDKELSGRQSAFTRPAIRALLERGRTYNSSNQRPRSRPLFRTAFNLAVKSHEETLAIDAAHMLGIVEPPNEGIRWNLRALEMSEFAKDPRARKWQGPLRNNLGWTYHDMGRFEDALALFRKDFAFRTQTGGAETARIAEYSIARTLRSLKRFDEALSIVQRQEAALAAAHRADGYVYEEIAENLLAKGRSDDARPWFAAAASELQKDDWLVSHEPKRLARIRSLANLDQ